MIISIQKADESPWIFRMEIDVFTMKQGSILPLRHTWLYAQATHAGVGDGVGLWYLEEAPLNDLGLHREEWGIFHEGTLSEKKNGKIRGLSSFWFQVAGQNLTHWPTPLV
jgi:hypothetical protein